MPCIVKSFPNLKVVASIGYTIAYNQYDCLAAPLTSGTNETLAWWTDRNDKIHTYWAGNGSSPIGCECGLKESCKNGRKCFCDAEANSISWSRDEGHLTNKDQLPITKVNFGGLGRATEGQRVAKYQIGPLYCNGADPGDQGQNWAAASPVSCKDLWLKGNKQTGYYMVKERLEKFPKVVFCDLSKLPTEVGFQRTFGSPGNLRPFVAFDVSLGESFYDDFRYINFTRANVNIGEGFEIKDGIFRVPVTGLYLFTVSALPMKDRPFMVQIHHNGQSVAAISNGINYGDSMVGQSILLHTAVGDEIRLYNYGGDIYEDSKTTREDFLHFVGILLHFSDRN